MAKKELLEMTVGGNLVGFDPKDIVDRRTGAEETIGVVKLHIDRLDEEATTRLFLWRWKKARLKIRLELEQHELPV